MEPGRREYTTWLRGPTVLNRIPGGLFCGGLEVRIDSADAYHLALVHGSREHNATQTPEFVAADLANLVRPGGRGRADAPWDVFAHVVECGDAGCSPCATVGDAALAFVERWGPTDFDNRLRQRLLTTDGTALAVTGAPISEPLFDVLRAALTMDDLWTRLVERNPDLMWGENHPPVIGPGMVPMPAIAGYRLRPTLRQAFRGERPQPPGRPSWIQMGSEAWVRRFGVCHGLEDVGVGPQQIDGRWAIHYASGSLFAACCLQVALLAVGSDWEAARCQRARCRRAFVRPIRASAGRQRGTRRVEPKRRVFCSDACRAAAHREKDHV